MSAKDISGIFARVSKIDRLGEPDNVLHLVVSFIQFSFDAAIPTGYKNTFHTYSGFHF